MARHKWYSTIIGIEVGVFESAGERKSGVFEIGIGEANFFAVAVGLDQADFAREAIEGIAQRRAQTGVLAEIEHEREC